MIYSVETRGMIRQIAYHQMSKEDLMMQLNRISYSEPFDVARIWMLDLIRNIGQMSDVGFKAFLEECLSEQCVGGKDVTI